MLGVGCRELARGRRDDSVSRLRRSALEGSLAQRSRAGLKSAAPPALGIANALRYERIRKAVARLPHYKTGRSRAAP